MTTDCILSIVWCDLVPALWQREPVPGPSLMEVFVGHQYQKQNPPLWPLQSVPPSSAIDDFNGDCWQTLIFGFHTSIKNIWIRKGSLEDALGHAGWQWLLCKGQTQCLQFVHCLVTERCCCCVERFGEFTP